MNQSVLTLVRELLPLSRVELPAELHCEFYLLNMGAFVVVTEWRSAQVISGNG